MSCAAHGLCAEERATNLPEGQRAGGLFGRGVQEILSSMLDRRSNMAGVDPSNIYSRFHLAPMASISPCSAESSKSTFIINSPFQLFHLVDALRLLQHGLPAKLE
jgi:hypothetical protein